LSTGPDAAGEHLRALPFQVIELPAGVVLKRGCTEVSVEGENAALVVQVLCERLDGVGATRDELQATFAPGDRPAVGELVEFLLERRLLAPVGHAEHPGGDEAAADVFHWHFGLTTERVAAKVSRRGIAVVGVNRITRNLVRVLLEAGVDDVRVLDQAVLRNVALFDGDARVNGDFWPATFPDPMSFDRDADAGSQFRGVGCIVAASDFGGRQLLSPWNQACVERELHFLPIVLEDLVGWIGPLVVPGRTACLACLSARVNASLTHPIRPVIERAAEGRRALAGAHPAMADLVGTVAAMELLKLYGGIRGWQVGRLIEVNLLTTSMTSHSVLRVPRCPACSALNAHAPVAIDARLPTVAGGQTRG
jgi:bacteriocin biosynthesis cyclodehydratase domain-containing protein